MLTHMKYSRFVTCYVACGYMKNTSGDPVLTKKLFKISIE